jgi:hypothetical protein
LEGISISSPQEGLMKAAFDGDDLAGGFAETRHPEEN